MARDIGKKFRASMKGHPEVLRDLNAKLAAETESYRSQRRDFADHMNQVQKKAEVKRVLKAAELKLAEIKRKQKEHQRILAVMTEQRCYSVVSLGDGRSCGGTKNHQKHRFEILDRIKSVSYLPPPRPRPGDSSKRCGTMTEGDIISVLHGGRFLQKRRKAS